MLGHRFKNDWTPEVFPCGQYEEADETYFDSKKRIKIQKHFLGEDVAYVKQVMDKAA